MRLSLLSLVVACAAVASSQTCYALDGSALDDTYAPCNPGQTHSSCCAIKRTTGSQDICLDTGLCMQTNNEFMGTIWQSGCTDPTGKDPACPKTCPDTTTNFAGQATPVNQWNIQTCDYGRYCCRAEGDHRPCCNSPFSPKVNTTTIGAFQKSPASSNITQAAPVANTPSTLPSSQAQQVLSENTCKKEKQATAIVGGTLGSIFGTIIIALCYFLFWMHKKERRQRRLKEHYESQFSQTNAYRKALASTAGSIRDSLFMEDVRIKTGGPDLKKVKTNCI